MVCCDQILFVQFKLHCLARLHLIYLPIFDRGLGYFYFMSIVITLTMNIHTPVWLYDIISLRHYLSYFSIVEKQHHDQENIFLKKHLTGDLFSVSDGESVIITTGIKAANRLAWHWSSGWPYILSISWGQRERDWPWCGLLKLKSTLSDKLPPTRSQLLILLKQFQQLGTKPLNFQPLGLSLIPTITDLYLWILSLCLYIFPASKFRCILFSPQMRLVFMFFNI